MQVTLQDDVLKGVSENAGTIMELARIAEKGGDELMYASSRIRNLAKQMKRSVNQALYQQRTSQEVAHV